MIKPRARRGFCLSGEGFCPLRDKAVCWHHPEGPGPAVAYCPLPVSPIGGSIGLDAASIWGISVNTPAVIEEAHERQLYGLVTGDTGEDLYTLHEEGSRLVRPTQAVPRADTAYDLVVPSGAAFVQCVLLKVGIYVQRVQNVEDGGWGLEPLDQILTHIKRFENGKYRIWRFSKLVNPAASNNRKFVRIPKRLTLLVIHDGGKSSNPDKSAGGKFVEKIIDLTKKRKDGTLDVLANVKELPEVKEVILTKDQVAPFKSDIWNKLWNLKNRVGIVVSLSTLQRAGAAVSSGLSWEQTVEDFTAEMHLFPKLWALSQFCHLFVRVDLTGLIHIENRFEGMSGRVYFAPYAENGIRRDPELEGCFVGKNTVLVAWLAQVIRMAPSSESAKDSSSKSAKEAFRIGIESAIRKITNINDAGYDCGDVLKPSGDKLGDKLIENSVAKWSVESSPFRSQQATIAYCEIPPYLLTEPPPSERRLPDRWHILDDLLQQAPIPRINIAMAIVKWGLNNVLNHRRDKNSKEDRKEIWRMLVCPDYLDPREVTHDHTTLGEGERPAMPLPVPNAKKMPELLQEERIKEGFELNVPVMTFGDLTAAEREEIEGLCSISNLLKLYIREQEHNKTPISIAVFGPPGTGKSFAVKQIAKSIAPDKNVTERFEYNVAQFQKPDDLSHPLIKATSVNAQGRIPIVFFDEFDCVLDGKSLGWLKYFLAPMQDGSFYGATQTIDSGRAIFVFAGGTHDSFENFDPRSRPGNQDEMIHFKEQKGPDFISRLRGHINVLPINASSGGHKHYIRRAILLRSLLEDRGFTYPIKSATAMVDDPVIYALLTIDTYRHGTRSMATIVQMCTPIYGRIQIASLPSREQLNMHVDAENFLIRVYKGRSRFGLFPWNDYTDGARRKHRRAHRPG